MYLTYAKYYSKKKEILENGKWLSPKNDKVVLHCSVTKPPFKPEI